MLVSAREYARRRGISHTAVLKAIKSGRITTDNEGKINPKLADIEWEKNTIKKDQNNDFEDVPLTGNFKTCSETSYMQAKTVNEVLKAKTNHIKLQQIKGELVSKNDTISHVFRLARDERDSWLNWPSRVAAIMAAELGVDSHTMHQTLEKHIRTHLEELSDIKLKL